MLLTKVLVSLQLLHSLSAQPIPSSKLLVKRAPVGGKHIGSPIDPSMIDEEGLAALNLGSSREAEEANATEKIEPVHEKGSHSKEVEDLASSSDLEELRKFFTGKSLEEFDDVYSSENLKKENFDISKLSQFQSKMLSEINEATSVQGRNPINTFTRCQNLMDKLDEEQKFFLWAIAFVDSQDDLSRHEIKSLYDLLAGSFKNPEMNEEVLEAIELINLQFKRKAQD
ncbi:uncharacterized protein PGTG_08192 [Puccinia graminis f. sp. tritici CRL 75-36-700-3]|uniref:Uncharacterized protein n=1 Tax=Puccinia graminis f. sp. tritici (strain CRL 75-36-700-3 / race SCCL) TaxID=418459 RepID=E3KCJ5_PUCGT|nr:uncharacterized protein PGTG_08192 [Puccinia graminis f. sp. tritici CRL 75-36-700-3]EFP81943.2 hypothetical protein PGTG_08192 [Puccinia graminis f. sp. tritici CRL 75-36-700-3]